MRSIVESVFEYGTTHPGKTALENGKKTITYGELLDKISGTAATLRDRYGIAAGDRVILAADKQPEFVSVYFACHLAGATVIPIAPDTNPKRYALIRMKTSPKLIVGFDDPGENASVVGLDDFQIDSTGVHMQFPDQDTPADIIFTTGTTGEPKGVVLTHRNLSAAARNINTFIGNGADDIEMIALPISHSFGLGRLRCALSNGQTVVLLGSFANVKRFFRFMEEYRVSGFGMVPASWALLKKLSGEELGRYAGQLRYIEIGSAPMPAEDKRLLIDLLADTRICMHYGLTEASRSAFIEFHSESDRLNTVGRQSPNMTITIRDEEGHILPDGVEGEICVSGDAVTSGYLDLPVEGVFWGDAFRTGDWGVRDAEGYISLKSRKKELINVGGKKVSPIEVEEVLKKLDFIDDCVCVGIPDPEGILGETVKAYVVTSHPEYLDRDNINDMIAGQLESYKYPIAYEAIDEIPKTASGKIQRLSLKNRQ